MMVYQRIKVEEAVSKRTNIYYAIHVQFFHHQMLKVVVIFLQRLDVQSFVSHIQCLNLEDVVSYF